MAGAATGLVTTPAQTEGPFYPTDWSGDVDNDLVVVTGEAAHAQGQITHILGRILDTSGAPIPGAAIEIWQCDASGIYRHPRDNALAAHARRGLPGPRPCALGRGRRLRVPHHQAGRVSRPHAAHPLRHHRAGRPPLVTQMYVAGEPQNERDGILNGIADRRQRDSVIVKLEPGDGIEAQALAATFDIVLAG